MKNYHLKKLSLPLLLTGVMFLASACSHRPSDEDIKARVDKQLQENPDYGSITSSVSDGVLTLQGVCASNGCDSLVESELKDLEGVKRVENMVQMDLETDLTLRTSVQSIISKYKGVQADVAAGVVVLRGSIDKREVEPLMDELKALKPRKLDNQLALK
ncbi:BON domain-containing protein [Pedobacter endophyticus]|uniref:BON domain-containing protein n=1 Tax=Pedobacter endophyticus TaxID=2789740 RepID=A0A7U3SQ59_9SPHI|nr:BON domain-containing protein [Pedobacter endophyticus]QPH38599.1 BON domain-containing protein [Pedobacter endophyticus]